MRTPWGNSQEETVILEGVLMRVETASHGGFFVYEGYRTEVRPSPTLDSTTWFEEDCDWAVAWLDLNPVLSKRKNEMRAWYRDRFDELTQSARDTVARWFPDLPELLRCFDCGHASIDPNEFTTVNIEPGYFGDLACEECR